MQEEIIYEDIELVDVPTDITTEEIEQTVETVEVDTFDIELSETLPLYEEKDSLNHALLNSRELNDQHPITAITGLREELDSIQSLKTVYSNANNIANYYKWKNASYDDYGYFVSIVPGTSEIKICNGTDILGVSIESAGFVGGQDEVASRDSSYGLIATSGLVDVRCELAVEVGDCVVSNEYGYATKSSSNYGYKVLALENRKGVLYAVISLGVQSDRTHSLGVEIQSLDSRVTVNEKNIISIGNVANQAYNQSLKAAESSSISEEALKNALESILNSEEKIKEFEKVVESTNATSVQARAIAEGAVTSSTSLYDKAINRANDAWVKADEVQSEVYSLCAKIDKHSVGEYSQAYGLTLEQAQSILKHGMIYVPTKHKDSKSHTEKYDYVVDDETLTYSRTFVPGYLYEWREIPNSEIGVGWVTVDKNYSETVEDDADETNPINTSAMAVYFSSVEMMVGNNHNNYAYWYTDSEEIYDINGNTGVYEPYTLYHWENDSWIAVATLNGNVSNRMVSEVYQSTNEIMMNIINPRGGIAGFNATLTDTEATVQDIARWTKGSDENGNVMLYNLATIKQEANDGSSSIALAVADVDGNKVLNGATIVLNQEDGSSSIYLDADKITLDGEVSFTTKDKDGVTKINGANIATGTITADMIVGGIADIVEINADKITSGTLDANKIAVINLNASNITSGTIDASKITVKNLSASNISTGTLNGKKVTVTNLSASSIDVDDLKSFGATIGDWKITDDEIYSGDAGMYSGFSYEAESLVTPNANSAIRFYCGDQNLVNSKFMVLEDGSLYASAAKIEGEIEATTGEIGGFVLSGNSLTNYTDESMLEIQNGVAPRINLYNADAKFGCSIDQYGIIITKRKGHTFENGWLTLFDGTTTYNLKLDHASNTVKFEVINPS